ncbi:MAG: DUF1572 domain-containing protein [Bacteroidetes bacterium]|nr:DUF1572 domain-containing protein [Bacteroidota bacterium]
MNPEKVIRQFQAYKRLGETAIGRMSDAQLHQEPAAGSNSVAVIVRHLHGNMLSRWTEFLTTDGEKSWRRRDEEFEDDFPPREELMRRWNEGWDCLFTALNKLHEADLQRTVWIREEAHSAEEAIHRQMMHYAYHIGQLVYLSKWYVGPGWESLSIPRGGSADFNRVIASRGVGQPTQEGQ